MIHGWSAFGGADHGWQDIGLDIADGALGAGLRRKNCEQFAHRIDMCDCNSGHVIGTPEASLRSHDPRAGS
jgi:hypothetical protein